MDVAIVYPVNRPDESSFTIPVQVSPESLQQVYADILASKWMRPREWVFRSLEFGGGLATAVATGFRGTPDLIKALGIYTGVGIPALQQLVPDQVPNYLANIVSFGMPELIKVPQNGSIGYKLLFFSKDNLQSMISDSHMYAKNKIIRTLTRPETYVIYLSFDTLEVPFELSVSPKVQPTPTATKAEATLPVIVAVTPSAATVKVGENLKLTVTTSAAETMPLTYQWFAGDTLISGETNNFFDIKEREHCR